METWVYRIERFLSHRSSSTVFYVEIQLRGELAPIVKSSRTPVSIFYPVDPAKWLVIEGDHWSIAYHESQVLSVEKKVLADDKNYI